MIDTDIEDTYKFCVLLLWDDNARWDIIPFSRVLMTVRSVSVSVPVQNQIYQNYSVTQTATVTARIHRNCLSLTTTMQNAMNVNI